MRRKVFVLLLALTFALTGIVSCADEADDLPYAGQYLEENPGGESSDADGNTGDEGGSSDGASEGSSAEDSSAGTDSTGSADASSASGSESASGAEQGSSSGSASDSGGSSSGGNKANSSSSSNKRSGSSDSAGTDSAAAADTGTDQTADIADTSQYVSDQSAGDTGSGAESGEDPSEDSDGYQLIYDINISLATPDSEGTEEGGEAETVTEDHTRYTVDQAYQSGDAEQVLSVEEAFPDLEDTTDTGMGYTDQYRKFVYWNSEPDGSGATLDPGEAEEVVFTDHDITLYAVWTKMDLTMSVDQDGDGVYDDDGAGIAVGEELAYQISYTNGYDVAVSLTVTEVLDEGLTFVSSDTGSYDEETRTLTWYLDDVESGSGDSLNFTAAVSEDAVKESEITGTAAVRVNSYPAVATNQVKNWVTIKLTVTGIWNDNEDQEKIRPESLAVQLLADGATSGEPAELNERNSWTYTWEDLPQYDDGGKITYTVESDPVEGYEQACGDLTDQGGGTYGISLTNEFVSATVKVSGSVTWEDISEEEDYSRKRPEEVTVHLFANGNKVRNQTLTEEDGWEWSFTGLDKYGEDGTEITYTVTEDHVKDYVTEIDGYEIVNSYSPYKVNLNVQLIFDDAGNEDGIRPESMTVDLLENGKKTGDTLTLDEANGFAGCFAGLDAYENGEDIEYTVEAAPADGYKTFLSEERDTNCILLRSVRTDGSEVETEENGSYAADTGDETPLELAVLLMTTAGVFLLVQMRDRIRRRHA